MRKILRVDTGRGTVSWEELPEDLRLYGGRGLSSAIIAREVDAQADPLGPDNKLVLASGLLSGTTAPNSSRLSVGTKSPLTGGIKEANAGGQACGRLGRLGVAAIVVEGDPGDKKWVLYLNKDGARLDDGSAYWGKGNYETAELLHAAYGEKAATIQIGPAGENGYLNSSVATTDPNGRPARHAGRGGVGAVMGRRGLKAVVVDDSGMDRPALADAERFDKARKTLVQGLRTHPVTSQGLPKFGTAILINIINEAGALPTQNFRAGRFDNAEKISGEELAERAEARGGRQEHGCMTSCIVHCSNIYHDPAGNYVSSGVEYETIWAFGADCLNDDLDSIAQMDRQCDDLGMDTIETGNTWAIAMDGGIIPWGDAQAMLKLFDEVRGGTDLGRKLANGAGHAAREFGVAHNPTVKNQAMPAYDPRAIKGIGVTYATSTMGADHTSGYAVATNILKVGGDVDPLLPGGQCVLSKGLQEATAAFFDSTGLCVFLAFACLDQPESLAAIPEMVAARYGVETSVAELASFGAKVLEIERDFNKRAGFTQADDRLPDFFYKETLQPHGTIWDVPDNELDQVCGWTPVIEMSQEA